MMTAHHIHYEIAERTQGMAYGGSGAIHLLARRLGLIEAIDARLHLLKIHLPYHASDHVLNLAYHALCDATCLQDMELRRNDEVFLDALGARRLPDPTTAGDFCRRFHAEDVHTLIDLFNEVRQRVWARQPASFFAQALIDLDGTLVPTQGECKAGMDIAYNGTWGYHPLVVSLGNTREVLSILNRPGNRPSHEGAAAEVDRALQSGNGMKRCRDRSKQGYERYVALGILGRNLQTLGKLLLARDAASCQAAKTKRKRDAG